MLICKKRNRGVLLNYIRAERQVASEYVMLTHDIGTLGSSRFMRPEESKGCQAKDCGWWR